MQWWQPFSRWGAFAFIRRVLNLDEKPVGRASERERPLELTREEDWAALEALFLRDTASATEYIDAYLSAERGAIDRYMALVIVSRRELKSQSRDRLMALAQRAAREGLPQVEAALRRAMLQL